MWDVHDIENGAIYLKSKMLEKWKPAEMVPNYSRK
jgi:hypothetical protein